MLKRTLALAFSAALVAASLVALPIDPAHAEMAAPTKESTKAKKELTPQQQKMKDCAAKWKDEKKAKNVSGRKAYNEFMSKCLKG
ncbi:MAG TPA: PsiF family protein [Xanthobacteraceae bacterium]|nr:PsiF family protein [Xanthobacteraceae bacterium]